MADDFDTPGEPSTGEQDHGLDLLIEQYLAGRLSEPEADDLLVRIGSDPAAGHRLLDQLQLDTMLREVADAPTQAEQSDAFAFAPAREPGVAAVVTPGRSGAGRRLWASPASFAVAASVVLMAGVAFWIVQSRLGRPQPGRVGIAFTQPVEATTSSVAVLTRTVDARWRADPGTSGGVSLRVGSVLERGWLRLDSGLAQIEFFNGAQVVLEGPVELQLVSASEAYCSAGKLRAEVPSQARGFRLTTPQINVVDRGTSFGVDVSSASAKVHVFKGLVELHERHNTLASATRPAAALSARNLAEGQAAAVDGAGDILHLKADASVFAGPADIDRRLNESHRRWLTRWRNAGDAARGDPSLLIRFDFENAGAGDRTLMNVAGTPVATNAPLTAGSVGDAAIVGCGWSEGRWPGKGALEYGGVGDRVRVEVPGELSSVTYAAWVRVHGLDRTYNSLFMSDAFNPGATHWQILRDGRIRLGVGGGKPGDTDSPVVFTPERLGQWIHLAVVYDGDARQITHYVEGRQVSRETIQPRKLVIGRAELGNWNPAPRSDSTPIRHFSGRIDEFSAYGRALADEEVAAMYAVGAGLTETAAP